MVCLLKKNTAGVLNTFFSNVQTDNMTYTYKPNTNQIQSLVDNANATEGFRYTSTAQYTYDNNGNVLFDPNKNLTITYNHLNLPSKFSFGATKYIEILYDASGQKLRKKTTDGTAITTQDYLGGIELKNNRLEAIYNEEGRAYNTTNATQTYPYTWRREYNLKDHLGNTRVSFTDKNANGIIDNQTELLQETHYYPFGMAFNGAWYSDATASKNKYLYNGKELNEEFGLNLSDYGARWYDASIGRWWSVDPLAEMTVNWSPYNYVESNPVNLIDPTGMSSEGSTSSADLSKKFADGLSNEQWMKSSNPANHGSQATYGLTQSQQQSNKTAVPYGYKVYQGGQEVRNVVEGYNWVENEDGGPDDPKSAVKKKEMAPLIGLFDGMDLGMGLHGYTMLAGQYFFSPRFNRIGERLSGGINPSSLPFSAKKIPIKFFGLVGKYSFYTGALFTVGNATAKIHAGESPYPVYFKMSTDLLNGTMMYLGGTNPYTLALGTGYFIIDKTVGWDQALQNYGSFILQERKAGNYLQKF